MQSYPITLPQGPLERVRFVLLDKWGTGWFGPDSEPTKIVYDGLELHRMGVSLKEDFLPVALTIQQEDPVRFLHSIAERFNTTVPAHLYGSLERVVNLENSELTVGRILAKPEASGSNPIALPPSYSIGRAGMFEDVYRCLDSLSQGGASVALCTNTWRLTQVRRVLNTYGVDRFFDHVLVSGELGIAKQAGVDFFWRCASIIGALPYQCAVVDDNLTLGVVPAVLTGMKGVLIDRFRQYTDRFGQSHRNADGSPKHPEIAQYKIQVITSLDELPGVLGYQLIRAA